MPDETRKPLSGGPRTNPDGGKDGVDAHDLEDVIGTKDPVDGAPTLKVRWYQKVFAWLNGKKTIIGAVVLTTGLVMGGPWGIVLKAIGTPLATIGVAHKIGKGSKKYGKPGEFGKDDLLTVLTDLWEVLKRLWAIIQKMRGEKQ